MARVHTVKKARKNYKDAGIKKGDTYFWWKFRNSPIRRSKTSPKRQQLTQSNFYISLYDLEDRINDLAAEEGLKEEVESIIQDIRALADEQEENKNNMPEGLQEGDTGQLLDERKDGLEEWADELEGLDLDIYDDLEDDKKKEAYQEKIDEVQGCSHSL